MWAAGSVVARRIRFPSRARRAASAHAATVFPTPPFPVRTTVLLPTMPVTIFLRAYGGENPVKGRVPVKPSWRESSFPSKAMAANRPRAERPFTSPPWRGTSMQGRSILPERRRTCSRWDEDWIANGPPAPTGITPFTTIRKFSIPSVRSSSRARSSSSTEVRSGRQTSVNSVFPGSRSAAMA